MKWPYCHILLGCFLCPSPEPAQETSWNLRDTEQHVSESPVARPNRGENFTLKSTKDLIIPWNMKSQLCGDGLTYEKTRSVDRNEGNSEVSLSCCFNSHVNVTYTKWHLKLWGRGLEKASWATQGGRHFITIKTC